MRGERAEIELSRAAAVLRAQPPTQPFRVSLRFLLDAMNEQRGRRLSRHHQHYRAGLCPTRCHHRRLVADLTMVRMAPVLFLSELRQYCRVLSSKFGEALNTGPDRAVSRGNCNVSAISRNFRNPKIEVQKSQD